MHDGPLEARRSSDWIIVFDIEEPLIVDDFGVGVDGVESWREREGKVFLVDGVFV